MILGLSFHLVMKCTCIAVLFAAISAMPLMGAEGLKLELIAPKETVVLSKAQLAELASVGGAAEALEEARAEKKPDLESLRRLEGIVMGALRTQQGIDLSYRITNPTDAAIALEHGGDATTNALEIKGDGAVDLPYRGMMTMEFRMGKPITIDPGASKEFTIKELKYGMRDMSRWLITKPGDYEITLIHRTNSGGKKVELTSDPLKLSVVAK